MIRAALALLLTLAAMPAAAQSWCGAGELTPTESTICRDAILGDLDAELEGAYRAAEDFLDRPGILAEDQRDWQRLRRDACRTDVPCIEDAYSARLGELRGLVAAPRADRRPWCDAARLNPAERAICGDDTLANLDAAMEAVYGALRAADDDRSQIDWLRGQRDACGADTACIAAAYLRRIAELGARLRGA